MNVRTHQNNFTLHCALNQIYRRLIHEHKVVKSEFSSYKWQEYQQKMNQAHVY